MEEQEEAKVTELAIPATFACPLCSFELDLKESLLFCAICNIFIGKPETYQNLMNSKFVQRRLKSQSTFDKDSSDNKFTYLPSASVRFLYGLAFYLGVIVFIGVFIGTVLGLWLGIALR